jgi:hypothetical protein
MDKSENKSENRRVCPRCDEKPKSHIRMPCLNKILCYECILELASNKLNTEIERCFFCQNKHEIPRMELSTESSSSSVSKISIQSIYEIKLRNLEKQKNELKKIIVRKKLERDFQRDLENERTIEKIIEYRNGLGKIYEDFRVASGGGGGGDDGGGRCDEGDNVRKAQLKERIVEYLKKIDYFNQSTISNLFQSEDSEAIRKSVKLYVEMLEKLVGFRMKTICSLNVQKRVRSKFNERKRIEL